MNPELVFPPTVAVIGIFAVWPVCVTSPVGCTRRPDLIAISFPGLRLRHTVAATPLPSPEL
jgi:hypothetical protein